MYMSTYEKDVFEAISNLSVDIPNEIVEREWASFKSAYRIGKIADCRPGQTAFDMPFPYGQYGCQ